MAYIQTHMPDLNYDGRIDNKDYCILANDFSREESPADIAPQPVSDGIVDFKDLALFVEYWLTATTIPPLPAQASTPYPANHTTGITPDVNLSWTAGAGAISHDVYFGTSMILPFIKNQTAATFELDRMELGTKYYWRINERTASGTIVGPLWSFTTTTTPPPPP
jgi:hypothetical protein